ncbi:MAG: hypothetical protein J1F35_06570 [Erysipelotrichales bacterium]|nr:hypothetical protein [Erysipelotrichales bacterium]
MSLNLLQPTIIKFENSYDLPETIRNKYAINYNLAGIEYESTDICRIYFVIKEDLKENDIIKFISKALKDLNILYNGTKKFVPGIDYFLNETLYDYIIEKLSLIKNTDLVLPNYLLENYELNSEIFSELCGCERDYNNLDFYYKKNIATDYKFTDLEINQICKTFANLILEQTNITPEDLLDPKNQSYKTVLEYFANGGTDCCTRLLQLILGNNFVSLNTISTLGSCGTCNSNKSDIDSGSCLDLYIQGIKELFKSMLGDIEFYEDWFCTSIDDVLIPNSCLIQLIKDLLDEFVNSHPMTISQNSHCGCPRVSNSDTDYIDFENYKKVLDFIDACILSSNKNKTKLFGEEFAQKLLEICQM